MKQEWWVGSREKQWALIVASLSVMLVLVVVFWPKAQIAVQPEQQSNAEEKHQQVTQTLAAPIKPKKIEAEQSLSRVVRQAPVVKPASQAKKAVPTEPIKARKNVISKSIQNTIPDIVPGTYIQVGSFKHRDGALKVAKKLKAHGWSAIVTPRKGMHAVQVGPYAEHNSIEKKALQQAKARLKSQEKLNGFVVHH